MQIVYSLRSKPASTFYFRVLQYFYEGIRVAFWRYAMGRAVLFVHRRRELPFSMAIRSGSESCSQLQHEKRAAAGDSVYSVNFQGLASLA